jgi:hypothetical protein
MLYELWRSSWFRNLKLLLAEGSLLHIRDFYIGCEVQQFLIYSSFSWVMLPTFLRLMPKINTRSFYVLFPIRGTRRRESLCHFSEYLSRGFASLCSYTTVGLLCGYWKDCVLALNCTECRMSVRFILFQIINHHHHQWLYSPCKDLGRITREVL